MSMVLRSLRPIPAARPANTPHSPSPQTLVREPQQVLRTATAEQELHSTEQQHRQRSSQRRRDSRVAANITAAAAAARRDRSSDSDSSVSDISITSARQETRMSANTPIQLYTHIPTNH